MKAVSSLLWATLALAACTAGQEVDDGPFRHERNSEFDGRELRFFLTLEDGTTASVGSGWGEDEGERVIDEYQGTLTLTADFTDGTLRGCIGCVGDIVTTRTHFGVFLGEDPRDVRGLAKDYELHLATAILGENGVFERDRVTVRHPERTVASSEGSWSGILSSRRDTDGNPRLVAGISDVEFKESDGSQGLFLGSFLGLSGTFLQDGRSSPLPDDG